MTQHVREWLPASALTDERIGAALQSCLDDWSGRWFPGGGTTVRVKSTRGLAIAQDGCVAEEGDAVRLTMPARGKRVLLEQVLDESLEGKNPTPSDHALLDQLARVIVRDLIERIERFPGSSGPEAGDRLEISLYVGRSELFRLVCPADPVIRLVRNGIARTGHGSPTFVNRLQAMGPYSLDVEAVLGRTELSVDDLADLGPGDVLVLDTSVSDAAILRLCRGGHHVGEGHLSRNNGRNALVCQL